MKLKSISIKNSQNKKPNPTKPKKNPPKKGKLRRDVKKFNNNIDYEEDLIAADIQLKINYENFTDLFQNFTGLQIDQMNTFNFSFLNDTQNNSTEYAQDYDDDDVFDTNKSDESLEFDWELGTFGSVC